MRYQKEILHDIENRFENKINNIIQPGSVINLYSSAIASVLEDVYDEIERNKNPHVWTKLHGKELDATGIWVNCPRNENESDESYKYRLMNWMLKNEASNTRAIDTVLLNVKHAENIDYIPQTRGCGTGTCYVLPKEYTDENLNASLEEAKQLVESIISPSLYVEYVIPTVLPVTLDIYISSKLGDMTYIKDNLTNVIKDYINSIPPYEYLNVGEINMMGINYPYVDYFNVLSMMINNVQINKISVLQTIDTKMILDQINWIEEEPNNV